MLEALKTVGRAYLERLRKEVGSYEALLRSLVQVSILDQTKTDERDPKPRKVYLAYLDVHRNAQGRWRLEIQGPQEVDLELLYLALWIGHARGKEFQDRATVNGPAGLGYLLSQFFPAMAGWFGSGLPQNSRLYQDARDLCEKLCLPLRGASKSSNFRWILNLPELNEMFQEMLAEQMGQQPLFRSKPFVQKIAKKIDSHLRREWGFDTQTPLLYSMRLNGNWVPRDPAYHHYQYQRFVESLFAADGKRKAYRGICYLCGRHTAVTADMTRLSFKVYINDKPGFASGFRKENFYRNYTLCQDCYQELLAGEAFLRTRLRSWLGTTVYVLPVFYLPDVRPSGANLEQWAGYVVHRWEASRTLDGWRTFHEQLEEYREFENQKAWFLLDFLFVEGDERAVKIQQYIQDVPPPRLDTLDDARHRTRTFAKRFFADGPMWDLSFQTLYYLFPIRLRGQGRQAFFQFLDALLHERSVDFRDLIPLFLETASVHYFQKYGAYVHKAPPPNEAEAPLRNLRVFLVQTQLLRYYLMLLGLFSPSGGKPMSELMFSDEIRRLVPEDIWRYMDALALNVAQRALFLLGCLIGEVARGQQRAGSVTVLNKIHFQGMDEGKVRRLSNEILGQMRIYRVLCSDTRDMFAVMRSLMDQARRLLTPAENTYWVLSGYAFHHLRRFGGAADESESSSGEAEHAADPALAS